MNIRIDKLNPIFRDAFTSLAEDYFLPNEDVEWLGDIAEAARRNSYYFPFGFVILTSKRVFRVLFYPEIKIVTGGYEPHRPFLHFERSGSHNALEESSYLVAPLKSELTAYEKKSMYIFETQIRNLIGIGRNIREASQLDVGFVSAKRIGATMRISDIKIMAWPHGLIDFCFYHPEEGREVYMLLLRIIDENLNNHSFASR